MRNTVATRRALRGRPLDTRLVVSPLRYGNMGAYGSAGSPTGERVAYVQVYGDGRAIFCARLALTHVEHSWLDYHGLVLGIEVLTGPDYRASAAAAREYYEQYVYRSEDDMENIDMPIVWSPWIDTRYVGE